MKNNIEHHSKDHFATIQKIKELAVFLEELKTQQPPSIGETAVSTVDFAIAAYNRASNQSAQNTATVLMEFVPFDNERLFGIPEVDIFGNVGTPSIVADDMWPTGGSWNAGGNNVNFYDLDVWYDLWNNGGMGKQQAITFIRGRSPVAINVKLAVSWRFITPGTN